MTQEQICCLSSVLNASELSELSAFLEKLFTVYSPGFFFFFWCEGWFLENDFHNSRRLLALLLYWFNFFPRECKHGKKSPQQIFSTQSLSVQLCYDYFPCNTSYNMKLLTSLHPIMHGNGTLKKWGNIHLNFLLLCICSSTQDVRGIPCCVFRVWNLAAWTRVWRVELRNCKIYG